MKILFLILQFIITCLKLLIPGGARKISAENLMLRNQLITIARKQKRSPKLTASDRIIFSMFAGIVSTKRLSRIAITIKPATLLKFHRAFVKRKYRLLFSNKSPTKPGPIGPNQDVINAVLEMKCRNPLFGYYRIAMQINIAFGANIDKDIVRRILNKYGKTSPSNNGPSWLTFLGHAKDSLWSVDLFRTESIHLKSHWVMIVMDQFTRRIIGFSACPGDLTGMDYCRMFNSIISKANPPTYLSSDNDPLFRFSRWLANLRIMEIEEIKTVPYTPISHPFVERLIGTIRRELLDLTFFWNANDLQKKLNAFQTYYNEDRAHMGIDEATPSQMMGVNQNSPAKISNYSWKSHCRGLFQLPIAA